MGVMATANISEAAGFGKLGGKKGKTAGSSTSDSKSNSELSMNQLKEYVEQIKGFKQLVDGITKGFPVAKELSEKDYMGSLTAFGFNAKGDLTSNL